MATPPIPRAAGLLSLRVPGAVTVFEPKRRRAPSWKLTASGILPSLLPPLRSRRGAATLLAAKPSQHHPLSRHPMPPRQHQAVSIPRPIRLIIRPPPGLSKSEEQACEVRLVPTPVVCEVRLVGVCPQTAIGVFVSSKCAVTDFFSDRPRGHVVLPSIARCGGGRGSGTLDLDASAAMPRTHFPNPANMGTTQELLDIQQTVRALADQLGRIEHSVGKPRGAPRGVRPTATLQAITIGGVQQPFFSGDQLGPLCFETLDVEQQFFEQLHAREADAAGGAARANGITRPCTPLRTPSHTPHPRRR